MGSSGEERAVGALTASGIAYVVTRHGRVGSLAEAAAARGVEPRDIVKTLVLRRAEDDFLFVLVPGDREISWPKLREHLGVNRVSMPDAATAYEEPTIRRSIPPEWRGLYDDGEDGNGLAMRS